MFTLRADDMKRTQRVHQYLNTPNPRVFFLYWITYHTEHLICLIRRVTQTQRLLSTRCSEICVLVLRNSYSVRLLINRKSTVTSRILIGIAWLTAKSYNIFSIYVKYRSVRTITLPKEVLKLCHVTPAFRFIGKRTVEIILLNKSPDPVVSTPASYSQKFWVQISARISAIMIYFMVILSPSMQRIVPLVSARLLSSISSLIHH